MSELRACCPEHGDALVAAGPGALRCPVQDCEFGFGGLPEGAAFPLSPMTSLEQGAAAQHEFVRSREAAGFSRSEAMQLLCCVVSATIMKGSGSE